MTILNTLSLRTFNRFIFCIYNLEDAKNLENAKKNDKTWAILS
jgi:hypothetical protein